MYSMIKDINCKSDSLVYMCTCPCPKNYVGKTTRQLRRRIGEHLGNIRRGDDTPLATHMRIVHPGHERHQIRGSGDCEEVPKRGQPG